MNQRPVDQVALVLAIGLATMLVLIAVGAILNVALEKNPTPTLGENTAQVLNTALGGTIGVLGTYIGHRVATERRRKPADDPEEPL